MLSRARKSRSTFRDRRRRGYGWRAKPRSRATGSSRKGTLPAFGSPIEGLGARNEETLVLLLLAGGQRFPSSIAAPHVSLPATSPMVTAQVRQALPSCPHRACIENER